MIFRDFHFGIIILVTLLTEISSLCLQSATCPCGAKEKSATYSQCINTAVDEKAACSRWANCATCESNTTYCLSCPAGRSGPTCTEDCGRLNILSISQARKGKTSQQTEFPWIVHIYVNETAATCGGVLVDHRTVLTVASCFVYAEHCTLYFSMYNIPGKREYRYVKTRMSSEIIIHPEFDIRTFNNNIAIVKFYPEISYSESIQPICMPTLDSSTANLAPGKTGYAMGRWLTEDMIMSDKLIVAPVPIQAPETCIKSYQTRNIRLDITSGMFCGGFADQNNIICRGASGFPLVFYDNQSHRFTLEGLVSHGTHGNCHLPERYTMFTKVLHFLKWILENWKM